MFRTLRSIEDGRELCAALKAAVDEVLAKHAAGMLDWRETVFTEVRTTKAEVAFSILLKPQAQTEAEALQRR